VVVATVCPPATLTDQLPAGGELTLARPPDRSIMKTALSPPGSVSAYQDPSLRGAASGQRFRWCSTFAA